jgi:translation initiation factor IF-2
MESVDEKVSQLLAVFPKAAPETVLDVLLNCGQDVDEAAIMLEERLKIQDQLAPSDAQPTNLALTPKDIVQKPAMPNAAPLSWLPPPKLRAPPAPTFTFSSAPNTVSPQPADATPFVFQAGAHSPIKAVSQNIDIKGTGSRSSLTSLAPPRPGTDEPSSPTSVSPTGFVFHARTPSPVLQRVSAESSPRLSSSDDSGPDANVFLSPGSPSNIAATSPTKKISRAKGAPKLGSPPTSHDPPKPGAPPELGTPTSSFGPVPSRSNRSGGGGRGRGGGGGGPGAHSRSRGFAAEPRIGPAFFGEQSNEVRGSSHGLKCADRPCRR